MPHGCAEVFALQSSEARFQLGIRLAFVLLDELDQRAGGAELIAQMQDVGSQDETP
jgi:hypothetical protein